MTGKWSVVLCVLIGMSSAVAAAQVGLEATFTAREGLQLTAVVAGDDGSVYGTLQRGGTRNLGTLVRRAADGQLTVLHSFEGPDGSLPTAAMVFGADGELYGTTTTGGQHGYGTLFRLTRLGEFSLLHHFAVEDGGASRVPLLLAADGGLIGVTSGVYQLPCDTGGCQYFETQRGSVFKMFSNGTFEILATGVIEPSGGLIQASNGDLYGLKAQLPSALYLSEELANGAVYRLSADGGITFGPAAPDLAFFDPRGELLESEGFLYGVVGGGLPSVFRVSLSAEPIDSVYETIAYTDLSRSGLARGSDGNIYGARNELYRLSPTGVLTQLSATGSLNATSGALRADGQGGFVVPTMFGMQRASQTGEVTALHNFDYSDGNGLLFAMLARDGSLYGATYQGGAAGTGTLFRVDDCYGLRVLHHNAANGDGSLQTPLVEGPKGEIFALLRGAPAKLIRLNASGELVTLHDFDSLSTWYDSDKLVVGAGGVLYGTVHPANAPTSRSTDIYRFDPTSNELRVLTTMSAVNALLAAADGEIYGIGILDQVRRVLFRVDAGGTLSVLHEFNSAYPVSNLAQGADGAIYGVANARDTWNPIVFRWTAAAELEVYFSFAASYMAATHISIAPNGAIFLGSETLWPSTTEITTTVLAPDKSVSSFTVSGLGTLVGPDRRLYAMVPVTRNGYDGFKIELLTPP